MQLLQTIALLCQIASGHGSPNLISKLQVNCQQSYLNCVLTKRVKSNNEEALQKCILEKK